MTGYLVDQINATAERGSLTSALDAAYCRLAKVWISPFPAVAQGPTDRRSFAKRIQELNQAIDIPAAPPRVRGGPWSPTEVLNSLNHMEVLLSAALSLEEKKWVLKRCAPTQQHLAEGENAAPEKIEGAALVVESRVHRNRAR